MLANNTYTAKNGKLKQTEYGNGDTRTYTYNTAGNLASEAVNGTTTGSWTYNSAQQPQVYRDQKSKQKHTYAYDITGRLLETKVSDTTVTDTAKDSLLLTALYGYDSLDRLERTRIYAGSKSPYAIYSYNKNGQPLKTELSAGTTKTNTYDKLGRLIGTVIDTSTPIQYNYRYHLSERNEGEETAYKTTLLMNELFGNKGYQYTYDKMGNITAIGEGTRVTGEVNSLTGVKEKITYVYDKQNQLIRENNSYTDQTNVYEYDAGGNITRKRTYAYTKAADLSNLAYEEAVYTYDSIWKDKLISYDGEAITYDAIGNPTTYRGKTLAWTGRTLDSLTQDGTKYSYTYNAEGLRTKKKAGSAFSEYYYSNGQLVYEKRNDCELYYTYDADGQLAVINCVKNNTSYIYYPVMNSRGDVEGFYNNSGELKVQYLYDAWGNIIEVEDSTAIKFGSINPIRYRGYYYDVETGFYYVSSRYYDPGVGRFISPDTTDILGVDSDLYDKNLYAYCDNNPVMRMDADGELWITALAVGAGIGVLTQAAADFVIGLRSGYSIEEIWNGLSPVDYVSAAIGGALATSGISTAGAIVTNAVLGGTTYLANCSYKGVTANKKDLFASTVIGGVSGVIGGKGANAEKMRGVYTRSKQVARATTSTRKKAMYNAKIKAVKKNTIVSSVRTFAAGVASNVGNFFRKLFTRSKA